MSDLISIIIPAYNIEKYIGRCLESVCAQTYQNLEIIVVNDGSTDSTGNIINEYSMRDYRIIAIHKENGGVTTARLIGITKASGTWIGFVDGDDYVEQDMFEKLLNNAIKYGADISHCGYKMIFPNGKIDYLYNTGRFIKQDNTVGLIDLLSGSIIEPGLWNKIFNIELFSYVNLNQLMDKSIKINEDFLMNYYLFKQSKLAIYEDVCPYHYILQNSSSATSLMNEHKLFDPIKVSKIILEDVKNSDKLSGIVLERMVRQSIYVLQITNDKNTDFFNMARKTARKELRNISTKVINNKFCNMKIKLMLLWVIISPKSYIWVHSLYKKIRGIENKFYIK